MPGTRKNKSLEYLEAVKLKNYLDSLVFTGEVLEYCHVVNEFKLGKSMMGLIMTMKAQGWRPGVPDYIIVTKNNVLFLELKKEKGGIVSDSQKSWMKNLQHRPGIMATVANGFEQARTVVDSAL